jgi:hypothetical protein
MESDARQPTPAADALNSFALHSVPHSDIHRLTELQAEM